MKKEGDEMKRNISPTMKLATIVFVTIAVVVGSVLLPGKQSAETKKVGDEQFVPSHSEKTQ